MQRFSDGAWPLVFQNRITPEQRTAVRRIDADQPDTAAYATVYARSAVLFDAISDVVNDPQVERRLRIAARRETAVAALRHDRAGAAQVLDANVSSALAGAFAAGHSGSNLGSALTILSTLGAAAKPPLFLLRGATRLTAGFAAAGLRSLHATTAQRIGTQWSALLRHEPAAPAADDPVEQQRLRVAQRFATAVAAAPTAVLARLPVPCISPLEQQVAPTDPRLRRWLWRRAAVRAGQQPLKSRITRFVANPGAADRTGSFLAESLRSGLLPARALAACRHLLIDPGLDAAERDDAEAALTADPLGTLARAALDLERRNDLERTAASLRGASNLARKVLDARRRRPARKPGIAERHAAEQPVLTALAAMTGGPVDLDAIPWGDATTCDHVATVLHDTWSAVPEPQRLSFAGLDLPGIPRDRDGNPTQPDGPEEAVAAAAPPGTIDTDERLSGVPDFTDPRQTRWAANAALQLHRIANVAATEHRVSDPAADPLFGARDDHARAVWTHLHTTGEDPEPDRADDDPPPADDAAHGHQLPAAPAVHDDSPANDDLYLPPDDEPIPGLGPAAAPGRGRDADPGATGR